MDGCITVDQSPGKSSSSEDEIFFGKMTLKEAKKHIFMERRTFTCIEPLQEQLNSSLRIIETSSEPDLLSAPNSLHLKGPKSPSEAVYSSHNKSDLNSSWDKVSDESFLKVENMVSMLTACSDDNHLDNTTSVVNKIINMDTCQKKGNKKANNELTSEHVDGFSKDIKNNSKLEATSSSSLAYYTPAKVEPVCTPHQEVFTTPSCPKKELFKTPAQPVSTKKVMSTKKTPSKTLAFQHISSPIASYIKTGPQVPLLKDVKPKKPLPSCTSIPKLQKSQTAISNNKENLKLPSLAYKSAKKTQVIKLPDESVMPSSQWAKKIHSSLPRPVVLKHDHRTMDFSRKPLASQTEDSFADLTYHQAELSVCTLKSALIKPKKIQK